MNNRKLGRSDITIAPVVFGGNVFGWTADQATSFTLLDRFVERGFNAVDTADIYSAWGPGLSGGESETVIGEWLAQRGRRDDVVLMTKVGMWDAQKGLSAQNIQQAVEGSLKRLRTDYIDVYFAHIDDETVPLEETLGAFARLIEAGKVRSIGASNYSAARLQQAVDLAQEQGLPRYEVIQPLYNLYDRADFEDALADFALYHELGVVSYFSLASGFLSGKYQSVEDLAGSARADFIKKYFDERGQKVLEALFEVARQTSVKPAQVALAWLLSRPALTAPIASATSVAQLDEILDSTEVVLSEEALETLNTASK